MTQSFSYSFIVTILSIFSLRSASGSSVCSALKDAHGQFGCCPGSVSVIDGDITCNNERVDHLESKATGFKSNTVELLQALVSNATTEGRGIPGPDGMPRYTASMGIALVHKDEVIISVAGKANIEENLPFTKDTLIPLASSSKWLHGVLVTLMIDDGLFPGDTGGTGRSSAGLMTLAKDLSAAFPQVLYMVVPLTLAEANSLDLNGTDIATVGSDITTSLPIPGTNDRLMALSSASGYCKLVPQSAPTVAHLAAEQVTMVAPDLRQHSKFTNDPGWTDSDIEQFFKLTMYADPDSGYVDWISKEYQIAGKRTAYDEVVRFMNTKTMSDGTTVGMCFYDVGVANYHTSSPILSFVLQDYVDNKLAPPPQSRACDDVPGFEDAQGYPCSGWSGSTCRADWTIWGYNTEEMDLVWANCPSSCDDGRTQCGACEDDASFTDVYGYACSGWSGSQCRKPYAEWGYTIEHMLDIAQHCPTSCTDVTGYCPSQPPPSPPALDELFNDMLQRRGVDATITFGRTRDLDPTTLSRSDDQVLTSMYMVNYTTNTVQRRNGKPVHYGLYPDEVLKGYENAKDAIVGEAFGGTSGWDTDGMLISAHTNIATYIDDVSPDGYRSFAGMVLCSIRSYANIIKMMVNDGEYDGIRVIASHIIEDLKDLRTVEIPLESSLIFQHIPTLSPSLISLSPYAPFSWGAGTTGFMSERPFRHQTWGGYYGSGNGAVANANSGYFAWSFKRADASKAYDSSEYTSAYYRTLVKDFYKSNQWMP